jgi:thiaminase/transcriptional activator TenA
MLAEKLWKANADLANACLNHPFVRGLADGSLNLEAFKRYVSQDAYYLRAFFKAYAIAAAKVPTMEHAQQVHRLMGGVFEELTLHAKLAARLDIDLSRVRPWPSTLAYTDFLQRTAWHGSASEILAAMTPCMRLYWFLGSEMAKNGIPKHGYSDWIATYSADEIKSLVAEIESLLNALADDTPAVRDAYRYAMQCELRFFAAPLQPQGG